MKTIKYLLRLGPLNPRWIRITALASVLLAVSLVLAYRGARANAAELLTTIGEQLMQLPTGTKGAPIQPLTVNGVELNFRTARADVPYEQVVQFFQEECIKKGGMQSAEFGASELTALQNTAHADGVPAGAADGVFVQQGPRGTVIACIDTRGVPWLSHEMLERAKRFGAQGDLQEIGAFRYALIKKTEYGAHAILVWSGQSTPLLKMFPKQGDAPGADHAFMPRIEGGRRVLSSTANGYQMVTYEYPNRKLNDVINESEGSFKTHSFQYKDLSGAPPSAHFWVSNGDRQAFVLLDQRKDRVISTIVDVPR